MAILQSGHNEPLNYCEMLNICHFWYVKNMVEWCVYFTVSNSRIKKQRHKMLSIDLKYPAWTTTMNKLKTSWPPFISFVIYISKMKENFFWKSWTRHLRGEINLFLLFLYITNVLYVFCFTMFYCVFCVFVIFVSLFHVLRLSSARAY